MNRRKLLVGLAAGVTTAIVGVGRTDYTVANWQDFMNKLGQAMPGSIVTLKAGVYSEHLVRIQGSVGGLRLDGSIFDE